MFNYDLVRNRPDFLKYVIADSKRRVEEAKELTIAKKKKVKYSTLSCWCIFNNKLQIDNITEAEVIEEISKQIYRDPKLATKDKLLAKFGKESMFYLYVFVYSHTIGTDELIDDGEKENKDSNENAKPKIPLEDRVAALQRELDHTQQKMKTTHNVPQVSIEYLLVENGYTS